MAEYAPNGILYRWPANAAVGRTVPKAKFYEHGNLRSALRTRFVDDVQRITWAYKLANATIHLQGTSAVPEIQVFTIETKGDDVNDDVLSAIDTSVHFPIVFEVANTQCVRTVAAYKTLGGATPKLGPYFTTDWLPADILRTPLPTALDIPRLYQALLTSLLPIETRAGETVSEATHRLERARKLRREIAALEKKQRNEKQLNRKIEIRRQIKERTAVVTELGGTALSNKG